MEKARQRQERYQQCQSILKHADELADARWQSPVGSWIRGYFKDSYEPDTVHASPHVVNTSTSIAMICEADPIAPFRVRDLNAFNGMRFDEIATYYRVAYRPYGWISREQVWSPYTSAWALRSIAAAASIAGLDVVTDKMGRATRLFNIVRREVDRLVDFLKEWAQSKLEPQYRDFDHIYFIYTALRGLSAIDHAAEKHRLTWVRTRLASFRALKMTLIKRISLDFYRQMTMKLADIPQNLDVVCLAMSLHSLLEFSAPDEELPEDVVAAATKTIFSVQGPTGFWDTGTPLLGSQTGLVGCSSVEIALCLLTNSRTNAYAEQYIDQYVKLFTTLRLSFKSAALGWPTDIRRRDSGRQTWYGMMVLAFISRLGKKLRELAAAGLLREFHRGDGKPKVSFSQLYDYKGYVRVLRRSFVDPWQAVRNAKTKTELETAHRAIRYSAILFGPPGTGKTSIAAALAEALEFQFIEIGPGDLLKKGVDGIFSQGDEVFHRLMLAERAVVLFDEMDEWVLDRGEHTDKLSRFLTTYMLPWLQRLRDKADIIFLFGTNHLEHFDDAIKRHGRIDVVLPIGPPQGLDKAAFLQDFIEHQKLPRPTRRTAMKLVRRMRHRTTIGDIKRALLRVMQTGYSEAGFMDQLAPDKLLISGPDWKMFREQCGPYLEPGYTIDTDRDPDEVPPAPPAALA